MKELNHPMLPADAYIITFCAWLPDKTSEINAVAVYRDLGWRDWIHFAGQNTGPPQTVGAMVVVQQLLHGLTGGDAHTVTDVAHYITNELKNKVQDNEGKGISDPNDLCALGFALHLYGDSFAHRNIDHPGLMYPTGRGHAFHFAHPDHPLLSSTRETLWEDYVRKVAPDIGPINQGDLNKLFTNVRSPVNPKTNDGQDEEPQLTTLLGNWLARLNNGHALSFSKGAGDSTFSSGEPCHKYVGENFASGKPKPDCAETWRRYSKSARYWFDHETNSRGEGYRYPLFSGAEPQWRP